MTTKQQQEIRLYWHPVMRSCTLKKKPMRVMLDGKPLVLFRTNQGIACLQDLCPHRFAPLSKGQIKEDSIECPYHGWRFDRSGTCTKMPLYEGCIPRRVIKSYDVLEKYGLVFVTENGNKAEPLHSPKWDGRKLVRNILEFDAPVTIADAVENVLEPVHTFFVHKGIVRGLEEANTEVTIKVWIKNNELEMHFSGEKKQDGLISRLLEGERDHSFSRFKMPGIAELEFWGKKHLNLVITVYFTSVGERQIKGFAMVTGARSGGMGYLKALVLMPILKKVRVQDLEIMTACSKNWELAENQTIASSPLDIVRDYIDQIIENPDTNMDHLPTKTLVVKL